MNPFDQATALVHDALAGLRESAAAESLPCASRAALEHLLAEAAGASPAPAAPVRAQPALSPSPRPPTSAPHLGLAARARAAIEAAASSATPVAPKPVPAPVPREALSGAPLPGSKAERLERLRERFIDCQQCKHLVASRSHVVFGVGNPDAQLMFVGEAPGADEDLQGEPFVGKAGQLLTKIIEAMGLRRSDVYIANVLKCRPDMPPGESGNRKPRPEEMATCLPYLIEQIGIIQPKCLVALGATAMEGLLGEPVVMRDARGRWHEFKDIPLMATYHPAYLLRNQSLSEKRKVWEDMLQVMERLGLPISAKQRAFFLPK